MEDNLPVSDDLKTNIVLDVLFVLLVVDDETRDPIRPSLGQVDPVRQGLPLEGDVVGTQKTT